MTPKQRIKHISKWIKSYATKHKISTLVVGISGGIDSSVVSALCAELGWQEGDTLEWIDKDGSWLIQKTSPSQT